MQYMNFTCAESDNGQALPYATVAVYLAGTTTPASLYDINSLAISNPTTAASNGSVGFACPNGVYDIQITSADGTFSVPLWRSIQIYDLNALGTGLRKRGNWSNTAADYVANDQVNYTDGNSYYVPALFSGAVTTGTVPTSSPWVLDISGTNAASAAASATAAATSASKIDTTNPKFLFGEYIISAEVDTNNKIMVATTYDGKKYDYSSSFPAYAKPLLEGPYFVNGQWCSMLLANATTGVLTAFGESNKILDPTVNTSTALKPITGWGSSLTTGYGSGITYLNEVTTLTGRTTNNFGIGGQTQLQIACRFGAIGVPITISGNQIVSGSNTVTALNGVSTGVAYNTLSYTNMFLLSTIGDAITRSCTGQLGSVHGTMTRTVGGTGVAQTGTELYTFTPDSGAILPLGILPPGTCFIADNNNLNDNLVLEGGYNDLAQGGWNSSVVTQIINSIQAMVNKIPHNRYVVTSVWTANNSTQYYGTTDYNITAGLNAQLASLFNFLDWRRMMIDRGMHDAALTPTSQDLIDIGHDQFATSLHNSDNLHPNTAGYEDMGLYVSNYATGASWI